MIKTLVKSVLSGRNKFVKKYIVDSLSEGGVTRTELPKSTRYNVVNIKGKGMYFVEQ